MNSELQAYEELLLIKKKYGIATEEELQLLNRSLLDNPAVHDAWNYIQQLEIPQDVLDEVVNPGERPLEKIKSAVRERKRRRVVSIAAVSAAACLVLLAGLGLSGWFPFANNKKATPPVAGNDKIQLQLESGKLITLSGVEAQEFSEGGMNVHANSQQLQFSPVADDAVHWHTLIVPPKSDYTITLPDGSTVRLNSISELKFPNRFTGNQRRVEINGEAYFTVKSNPSNPFIVTANNTSIKVLGTTFDVNTYKEAQVNAALVEGSILLDNGRQQLLLQPGQQVSVTQNAISEVSRFNNNITLSWLKGIYIFDNAPLSETSVIVPRWLNIPVVFDDPSIKDITFSGSLNKTNNISVFIDNLNNTLDIKAYLKNNTLHLGRE